MGQVGTENTIMNLGSSFKTSVNSSSNVGKKQAQEKFSRSLEKAKASNKTEVSSSNDEKESVVSSKKDKAKDDKTEVKTTLDSSKKKNTQAEKDITTQSEWNNIDNEQLNSKGSEELNIEKGIDAQMLAMISDVLQIPVEEIQSQLEEMGMNIQELLTEEGFGKLINQVLAQGDMNALLSGEIDIQKVTQLFEDLNEFKKQMPLVQDKLIDEGKVENSLEHISVEESILAEQIEPNEQEVIQEQFGIQALDSREVKSREGISRFQVENEEEHQLSFVNNEESVERNDLGMNIPIRNFTTTMFTQSFESQPGVITEATVTKQIVNGKSFIEQVDVKVLSQTKEINIALSPRELGNMNVKIVEQHGMMVAEIKVDNEKAKDFILNEINDLRNSLEEQGLNVADVKVDIRQDNHETQMQQERQKSSRRIQEILASFDEEEEEETIEPLMSSNSEVDYMV